MGVLAVAGHSWAVTGTVKNERGEPVVKAKVCHFQYGVEYICVETGADGGFEIHDSSTMSIRVAAEGYLSALGKAAGRQDFVLRQSASLFVRLVDAAAGKAIERGEVLVIDAAGEARGPFPANAAGVRLARVVGPGTVKLIGSAEGYLDTDPVPVTLHAGKENEAELRLEPRPPSGPADPSRGD